MNNPESLRVQLIDAMAAHVSIKDMINHRHFAERFFEEAIWPTLDAAMKAGELLVARNTTPPKSVNEALVTWLEAVVAVVQKVKDADNATRRELIDLLYSLDRNCQVALAAAKAVNQK